MSKTRELPAFLKKVTPWERRFSRKYRVALVHRMNEVLREKGISQKELATNAGWKDPYVSRLLGGDQNLTLKTIARFEEAVGEDVLLIPPPQQRHTVTRSTLARRGDKQSPKLDAKKIYADVEAARTQMSQTGRGVVWSAKSRLTAQTELVDVY